MRFRVTIVAACLVSLILLARPADAQTIIGESYQDVCRAEEIPKWAYGKPETSVHMKPLFGCDYRFGARRDADERFVEKLQARGLEGTALSWELVRQGWKWIGARKLQVALNRFNLAFEADPRNGDVYHGIAVVMVESGQPANVVDYWFRRGIDEARGQPGRYADYGRFLNMQGRSGEALPVLEKSLELEPGNAWTMMNLAALHFQREDQAAACAMIERLKTAAPPPGYPEERFREIIGGWLDRGVQEGC